MYMGQTVPEVVTLGITELYDLLCAVQRIRYNGATMTELFRITEILCHDIIQDMEVVGQTDNGIYHHILNYRINENAVTSDNYGRHAVWQHVLAWKFKYLNISQIPT
jgi:hypothetical protein